MEMTTLLHRLLTLHEDLRLKPYRCTANKWTIGVGHNFEDNGFPLPILLRILQEGFTEPVALALLDHDIKEARRPLLEQEWFTRLDSVRQDALTDMCFNLGWARFSRFRNMIAALEKGDLETAADEMLDSAWKNQVGARAYRLAGMIRTGKVPNI